LAEKLTSIIMTAVESRYFLRTNGHPRFPLALHGGPLWQSLCYAQIGGLTVATFITLLMVPVFYSIFVLDRKFLTWDAKEQKREGVAAVAAGSATAPATRGD
jgi:hypothetical protein